MESKKQKQVGELIRRNFVSVLFQEGIYIYGSAMVTVTNVIMSPDLGIAKIYLSVYNSDNKQLVVDKMSDNTTKLRQVLSQRIKKHVRRIPYISFYLDELVDEMYRVNELMNEIKIPKKDEEE